MAEAPHVYRTRLDTPRPTPESSHYCKVCNGWYGVPHHHLFSCNFTSTGGCACRECQEYKGLPRQGMHGYVTAAKKWRPPEED